jgi:hypothetical protein
MAGSLGTLTVTLGVDAREFQSGLKDAQTSVGGFSDKVKNIGSTIAEGIKASQTTILQAVRALDKQLGTDLNSILSGAFLALDLAEPFAGVIRGAIAKVMGNTTVMAATTALGSFLGLIEMEARTLAAYGIGAIQKAVAALLAFQIPLAAAGTTVGTVTGTAIGAATALAIPTAIGAALLAGGGLLVALQHGLPALGFAAATSVTEGVQAGVAEHLADDVREGMVQSNLAVQFPKDMEKIAQDAADAMAKKKIWDDSAQSITGDLATALKNNRSVIDEAMDKVQYAITHPLEEIRALAEIEAGLAKLAYLKGLEPEGSWGSTVIDQQIAALKLQWQQITGEAYTQGSNARAAWLAGYGKITDPYKVPGRDPGHKGPGGVDALALGGSVYAGTPYIVGERGPEMFVPNVNGTIVPNGASKMGGDTYNFTINDATDPQRVAAVIENYVRSASRVRHQRWSTG